MQIIQNAEKPKKFNINIFKDDNNDDNNEIINIGSKKKRNNSIFSYIVDKKKIIE